MRKDPNALRFKTHGYSATEDLAVNVGPSRCGNIGDGVTFWHDNNGAWVLSYNDLMTIAREAERVRRERLEELTSADAVDQKVKNQQ